MSPPYQTPNILGALRIVEDEYAGKLTQPQPTPEFTSYRGPYQQRRLKRWYRAHRAYYAPTGNYFVIGANPVICLCHPHDATRVRELLGPAAF